MAVTISTRGRLVLNAAAARLFAQRAVKQVLLLWDAQDKRVALQPIDGRDDRLVAVSYSPHAASIYAPGFLEHIHAQRGRYPAIFDATDGLEFSLNRESVK